MSTRPCNGPRSRCWPGLVVLAPASLACAGQPATAPAPEALSACASITDSAERLACYDKLAGRTAAPAAPASAPARPQPGAAQAPAPAAVSAAAQPPPPAAPGSGTAPAAPPSRQSFGRYGEEHPKPPPVSRTLEAHVIALGKSEDQQTTVTLDGGAVWKLMDGGDPLLAVGDTVTIARAAFGSYLMQTPTKRTHRVRRLD